MLTFRDPGQTSSSSSFGGHQIRWFVPTQAGGRGDTLTDMEGDASSLSMRSKSQRAPVRSPPAPGERRWSVLARRGYLLSVHPHYFFDS